MRSSYKIALASIAAALSCMLLALAMYVPYVDTSCMVFASLALSLPFIKRSISGGVLAYLAAGIIGFFMCGGQIYKMVAFWLFYGLYPLLACNLTRLPKQFKILTYCIKVAFFQVSLCAVFFCYQALGVPFVLFEEFVLDYYILALAGTVVFLAYDWMFMFFYARMQVYVERYIDKK